MLPRGSDDDHKYKHLKARELPAIFPSEMTTKLERAQQGFFLSKEKDQTPPLPLPLPTHNRSINKQWTINNKYTALKRAATTAS